MAGVRVLTSCFSFFFNDTATTEIYTLSLHDALPISIGARFDAYGNLIQELIPRDEVGGFALPTETDPV